MDKSKITEIQNLNWDKELQNNQKQDSEPEVKKKKQEKEKEKTIEKKKETKETKDNRLKISPLAKRLSKENNVDYKHIKGTGPNSRIIKY